MVRPVEQLSREGSEKRGGREGGGSGVRVRVEGEGGSERPRRGADRMLSFSLVLFSLADWGGGDWGALLGSSISIWDWIWVFEKPAAVAEPLPWPFGPHAAGY